MRFIENRSFFQAVDRDSIKFGAGEIGEQQHRLARLAGDVGGHQSCNRCHFFCRAVRDINQKDALALMLDVTNAFFHGPCLTTEGYDPSSDSTTVYASASAESSAAASFPPASARSGRPPPFPPTFRATGAITLPACTRAVRSFVTPTMSDTLPFDADPSTTTPEPSLSRS